MIFKKCIVLSGIAIFFIPSISLSKPTPPKMEDYKIAELIRTHLSYRYKVDEYFLNLAKPTVLGTFVLKDGKKLTYAPDGTLLMRSLPGGVTTFFEKGYPIKTKAFPNKIIGQTKFIKNKSGKIIESTTTEGSNKIVRYYNDGNIDLEIQKNPKVLLFRQGFHFSSDGYYFSYFETNAKNGLTDRFVISLANGLVKEQWRVTGGIARNWRTRYWMLMHLLAQDFKIKYSNRNKFRRDSFNRTKGELLLQQFKARQVFPISQFSSDYKNEKIKFDKSWKHIDCFDIVLTLPKIEFVQIEKQVVEPVVVKGHTVYQWIAERKKWEVYPYDSKVEKLIPTGLQGEAKIVPLYNQFQWQRMANQYEEHIIANRFIIKDNDIAQLKEQLANIAYYRVDPDDFQMMITEAIEGKIRAVVKHNQPVEEDIGQPLRKLDKDLVEAIQMEVLQFLKVQWHRRPELQQRDELLRTQAQYMMRVNQAHLVLPSSYLIQQKAKLFKKRVNSHSIITFKNLSVKLPVIIKKKSIKILDKVKLERGVIKVWEPDLDLPEKGYWRHYVLRPERDVLDQDQDRLLIKVDEGRFKWSKTRQWRAHKISGKIYLSDYAKLDKKTNASVKPAVKKIKVITTSKPDTKLKKKVDSEKPAWKTLIKRWITGEEIVIHEKQDENNQTVVVTDYKNRFGRIQRYSYRYDSESRWYEKFYDDKHRLLSFKNHDGFDFRLIHGESETPTGNDVIVDKVTDDLVDRFYYKNNILSSLTFVDDSKQLITVIKEKTEVLYESRLGKPILSKLFGENNKISEIHFANAHHVFYFYPSNQTIELKVVDSKKRRAFLIFNREGILLDKRGEKQLINLVFINYDFFKPHTFRNLHNRFVSN